MQDKWVPEIFYEEDEGGLTSSIPFIAVPENQCMPPVLFIFESRETGEYEPDENGNESPISEITLHQYADMVLLKQKLTPEEYDRVRDCLGLLPLQEALEKGKKITQKVSENV
jgi:hypothetical protein